MFSRFALAPFAAALVSFPVHAQQAPVATSDAVLSFAPADFAAANPTTALDMIRRLPGFKLESQDEVRGFASGAGNVLIDGQRPTIKTETLADALGRIPIQQVQRIDLIRGGAQGIDMQGRTVVANVIRKQADSFQQAVQIDTMIYTDDGKFEPGWKYELSRRSGEHQIDVQLARVIQFDDSVGTGTRTRIDYPAGATVIDPFAATASGPLDSLQANYKGPVLGGVLSLNGRISADSFTDDQTFTAPGGTERYINESGNERAEIGANYKRLLVPSIESESIFLSKYAQGRGHSRGDLGGAITVFEASATAGETIGRSLLRWTPTPQLTLEGGGEIAFNFREQLISLTDNGLAVSLPAAQVRIEELRGEIFTQASWRPSDVFSLDGGVRLERSKITQSGDTALEREFTYPKPRLSASWSALPDTQLRARIEREVGQLNFRDFISNVTLNTGVLAAGNADLRPDKRWVYEAAIEQRFWDTGAAVLTLRHEDIEDVSDVFPFQVEVDANGDGIADDADSDGVPDTVLVSGPGNIGDGENNVVQLSLTLPLAPLGNPGGQLKVDGNWREGRVRDPLTGERRILSKQRPREVTVTYLHDLPQLNTTFSLAWYSGWSERYFRLQERQTTWLNNLWEATIEYKPTPQLTFRAELKNLDHYSFFSERIIYDGPRGASGVDLVETERRRTQPIFYLRGRLTF